MKKRNGYAKPIPETAQAAKAWADVSNALFDLANSLIVRVYPGRAEREEFRKTEQYRQVRELLAEAVRAQGVIEEAMARKNGHATPRPQRPQ